MGDIADGDTIGMLESLRGEGRILAVRAVTDCEVVIIDAAAASDITSRNKDLAAAFNRLREIRSRRVDRLLNARAVVAAAEPDADTAATDRVLDDDGTTT